MRFTAFLDTQEIDLSMRTLNHYATPPHFALDDVTRFKYAETAGICTGPCAQAALIKAATAIQNGDIGIAEIHLAAARLLRDL